MSFSGGTDADAMVVAEVGAAVAAERHPIRALAAAFAALRPFVPFAGGSVALVEGDDLVIRVAVGPFADAALGQRLPRGRGLSWRVIETGAPSLSNDLWAEGARATTPIRAFLAVPLHSGGTPVGLLEIDSPQPGAFSAEDARLLARVAEALAEAPVLQAILSPGDVTPA